jgi:hypothetical protein
VEQRSAFGCWAALWRESKTLGDLDEGAAAFLSRKKQVLRRCVQAWHSKAQEALRVERGVTLAAARELKRLTLVDAHASARCFSKWMQLMQERARITRIVAPPGKQYTAAGVFATWAGWLCQQRRVRAGIRLAADSAKAGDFAAMSLIKKMWAAWARWAVTERRLRGGVHLTARVVGAGEGWEASVLSRRFNAWARWAINEEGRVARAIACVSACNKATEEATLLRACVRAWKVLAVSRRSWISKGPPLCAMR